MPTGYTCIIESNPNVTLRDYALRCARAFGACVTQRDESLDQAPRPREVSDHYATEIAQARARLLELNSISPAAARALWEADCESRRKRNAEYAAEHARKGAAYASMRAQVEAWVPPTVEHEGLRSFMLDQIDMCYRPGEEPFTLSLSSSPEAYIEGERVRAERGLVYYAEEQAKEIDRVKAANAWLEELAASLPRESSAR